MKKNGLGTCFRMILCQEFKEDFEVIVVDSIPQIETIEIAEKFRAQIVKLPKENDTPNLEYVSTRRKLYHAIATYLRIHIVDGRQKFLLSE